MDRAHLVYTPAMYLGESMFSSVKSRDHCDSLAASAGERRKRDEHNIQRYTGGHVLEHPALRSLPARGRPACGGHASGGGSLDAGAAGSGRFHRSQSGASASYATLIAVVYLLQAIMGAWIYIKYRTYVRIPMEQLRHFWTVGSFEFKEHVVTMGLGLLPAYWYFWRQPLSAEYDGVRRWVTVFLTLCVWYSFIVGHVANDFRGVGS
jgi:hypothetical protein